MLSVFFQEYEGHKDFCLMLSFMDLFLKKIKKESIFLVCAFLTLSPKLHDAMG